MMVGQFFSPLSKKNFDLGAKIKTFLNLIGLKIEIEFLLLVSQTATNFFWTKIQLSFFPSRTTCSYSATKIRH